MQSENVTTPFGRRPMTLAMLASQAAARDIAGKSAEKWKLFRALCEARRCFGVTDRALAVLNALLSFYPHAELAAENGLIVFPSNAQLSIRANGMAEATIRRHLAVLVSAGLLVRKDSANGKRYARRGGDGELGEAFGFSLAPLLSRADEIEACAARVVADRQALRQVKERLTICRRDIVKLLATALEEGAGEDWEDYQRRYRAIINTVPRAPEIDTVEAALSDAETLKAELVNRLEMLVIVQNRSGNPQHTERHIQNSNTKPLVESEQLLEPEQAEPVAFNPQPMHLQIKSFPLSMVLRACPDMLAYAPQGMISDWRGMMAAAVLVRSMLGVSPSAYQEACEVMGPENAAVAIACILERGGQINSPGGYLRDLTRKAARGEFSLGPMLMALLRSHGIEERRAS